MCAEDYRPNSLHLACICKNGFFESQTQNNSDSLCLQCGQGEVSSEDGQFCVKCLDENGVQKTSQNGECNCNTNSITTVNYVTQNGSTKLQAKCSACPVNTLADENNGKCVKCTGYECYCGNVPNNCNPSPTVVSDIMVETGETFQSPWIQKLAVASEFGCTDKNLESCQALANLCVLQNYNRDPNTACNLYENLHRSNPSSQSLPTILYFNNEASIELFRESAIDGHFDFVEDKPNSYLDIQLATFTLNGTFLGFRSVQDGQLQVCPSTLEREKGAYKFGRLEKLECRLSLTEVLSGYQHEFHVKPTELLFHELYLRYKDSQGQLKMYPVPILNENVRYNGQYVNKLDSSQDSKWILTRRFYLLDEQVEDDTMNILIRVPVHISLHVHLQLSRDGRIFPPHLRIRHNQYYIKPDTPQSMSRDLLNTILSEKANFQFQTVYVVDSFVHDKTVEVIMAVLSSTCVLWGAIRAVSWGRRAGKQMIDASAFVKFVLYVAENLGNSFLLVVGCTAVWLTFAYKLQKEMVYVTLTYEQEWPLVAYIISGCSLKGVSLLHTYLQLIFTETFFVDWERPRATVDRSRETTMNLDMTAQDLMSQKGKRHAPVVIWRTYLIANEWNELQYYRKTSACLQLIAVLFILDWLKFGDWAIVQPGFQREGIPFAATRTSRFAVDLFVYLFVAMIQWLVNVIIVEKIVDPFRNFMDLCSVANISVLALTHPLRAYYIHGRSVHGMADTDMLEMNMFLQREKENLCGLRGLESNSELQTFICCLPRSFREKLDELTATQRTSTQGPQTRINGDKTTAKVENTAKVHADINQFVKDFIDHADPSCDYVVTEPRLLEDILDLELADTNKMGHLIRDPSEMAYSCAFIYGNEWAHMSFEMLLFCVIDMFLTDRIISIVIVYAVSYTITNVAKVFFTNNLVKSSLVDHRFLI